MADLTINKRTDETTEGKILKFCEKVILGPKVPDDADFFFFLEIRNRAVQKVPKLTKYGPFVFDEAVELNME